MPDVESDLGAKSTEHELMFVAAVSVSPEYALETCSYLTGDEFFSDKYRDFWVGVKSGRSPNDMVFDLGIENDVFIAMSNMAHIPVDTAIEQSSRKICEYSQYRSALNAAKKIAVAVSKGDQENLTEVIEELHSRNRVLYNVSPTRTRDVDESFRRILFDDSGVIKTMISGYDNSVGGLFPGELIVLAARPGMGKTALALQIAKNVSFSGKRVLFFSLEMNKEQLWARMVCPISNVEWRDVRVGNITEQQKNAIELDSVALAHRLKDNFFIQDDVFTLSEIHAIAIQVKPDLVIVDQLPDIQWHNPDESEVSWYGKACKYLIQYIAKGCRVPVVLLHQLSRNVEGRSKEDKKPTLSDLKWSGEVEQRADVVLMMYREDYYEGRQKGSNIVDVELLVRKNRQGEMSMSVLLKYDLKTQIIY